MSNWTHIVGSLYIETNKMKKNIKEYVIQELDNAPKITGSERNADIFINELSGSNVWCDNKEYQTCVCISIIGDLRDRSLGQTEEEYVEFIDFIRERFMIRDSSIKIYEEWSGTSKQFNTGWFNE